jgi:hypothetical protein
MSAWGIAALIYVVLSVLVIVAFCRAAARGDRPMDDSRSA